MDVEALVGVGTAIGTVGLLIATGFLAWFTWQMAKEGRGASASAREALRASTAPLLIPTVVEHDWSGRQLTVSGKPAAYALAYLEGAPPRTVVELVLTNRGNGPAVVSSGGLTDVATPNAVHDDNAEIEPRVVEPGGTCRLRTLIVTSNEPAPRHVDPDVWPMLNAQRSPVTTFDLRVHYTDVLGEEDFITEVSCAHQLGHPDSHVRQVTRVRGQGRAVFEAAGAAFLKGNPDSQPKDKSGTPSPGVSPQPVRKNP